MARTADFLIGLADYRKNIWPNKWFFVIFAAENKQYLVDDATRKRKKNILKLQLQEFYYSMRTYGLDSNEHIPTNWQEAFYIPSDSKIDLIINRDDRFICLCEMKFTRGDFEVTKSYSKTLLERMERVQEIVRNKKFP